MGGNMKALNTQWRLIALGAFVVLVTVCAGRVMEAKAKQDYTAQSARVRPQIREAAINAFGPIGLTRGQTLRVALLVPGPHVVLGVTVLDCGGNTLMDTSVDPTNLNTCSIFDLNADQLAQGEFDNFGRAEVSVSLKSGGDVNKPGSFSATAEVFDNNTGKGTVILSLGHPGGVN
jgi:hypothetical protein